MTKRITSIYANSREGGDVYRLLNMVHVMAGRLANSPSKDFQLKATQSDPSIGPIVTVWTNGVVDIEARSIDDYHEYSMVRCVKDEEQ